MPQEPIGDKKPFFAEASKGEGEQEKQSAKDELQKNIEEIKKRDDKKSWLKEKFDYWREQL